MSLSPYVVDLKISSVLKRVRKLFEKIVSSHEIVAKKHKKNIKLRLKSSKSILISKLVSSKKSSKSIVKDKSFATLSTFTVPLIEVSFDNEKNENQKENEKKNEEQKKENIERTDVSVIIKKLFDKKDRSITDFKKRVNDVEKDHINVSNIQNFEKNANENISAASKKKKMNETFTVTIKTYILV